MLGKVGEFGMALVARFRSGKGQALAEHVLILALVRVVSILPLTAAGVAVSGTLDRLTQCLI